jgi:hypothetical protein
MVSSRKESFGFWGFSLLVVPFVFLIFGTHAWRYVGNVVLRYLL